MGHAFLDANVNGRFDSGEAGIANDFVSLMGNSTTLTAQTDSAGAFQFTGLALGTYNVWVMAPIGMSSTGTQGGTITLTAAQPTVDIEAGFTAPPPVLTQTPNQANTEGDAVSLQVSATVAGGGSIAYAAAGLPAGLAMNSTSGQITGTVAVGDASATPYSVTVTATSNGVSSQETFTWTIIAQGGPEIWTGPANGDWATGANWSSGVAPDASSDVIFDGAVDNADCIFSQAVAGLAANSVTFQNGYSATLHLQQSYGAWAIGSGGITQSSGDIEQESGQDINVGGDYNMSGGSIDANLNNPMLTAFNVNGGGKMNLTGLESIGANVKVKNGSSLFLNDSTGVVVFTRGAGISIDAGGSFTWTDGDILSVGSTTGVIANAGNFRIVAGQNASNSDALPIQNTGRFSLEGGATLNITGQDASMHGYSQTGGSTDLWNGTNLTSSMGDVYIDGGNFWVEGLGADNRATITANVTFVDGVINLNRSGQLGQGALIVLGNLAILDSTLWICNFDGACFNNYTDSITSTKTITIGGGAAFSAHAINVPAAGVTAGNTWKFLASPNAIAGEFMTMNLDFGDGTGGSWALFKNPAGNQWSLDS